MAKEDFNLDEELKNSLDFLDDNELNAAPANNYLSAKSSLGANKSKLLLITAVVAVVAVVIMVHLNKKQHKYKNQLISLPDKPLVASANVQQKHTSPPAPTPVEKIAEKILEKHEAPTAAVLPSAAVKAEHPQQLQQEHHEEHHVTWQDLKQAVTINEPPTTTTTTSNNPPTSNNTKVSGFEHNNNQLAQQQVQAQAQEHLNELKLNIENITKELSLNASQIQELQNNLKDISRSIGNVDSKILNLTNTIDTLSANVKKYTQDEDLDLIANIKPSDNDLFAPANNTKNTPEYVVHAVIPGRAWLKSASGQIITVAEGDVLGDYGKVALIDAANNLVRTSSGVIFR